MDFADNQDRFGEGFSDSTGAFSDMSASEFGITIIHYEVSISNTNSITITV